MPRGRPLQKRGQWQSHENVKYLDRIMRRHSPVGSAIAAACRRAETAPQRAAEDKNWQAVAPGLVEPRSGEIKLMASVIGRSAKSRSRPATRFSPASHWFASTMKRPGRGSRPRRPRSQCASAPATIRPPAKAADRRKAEDAVDDAETT